LVVCRLLPLVCRPQQHIMIPSKKDLFILQVGHCVALHPLGGAQNTKQHLSLLIPIVLKNLQYSSSLYLLGERVSIFTDFIQSTLSQTALCLIFPFQVFLVGATTTIITIFICFTRDGSYGLLRRPIRINTLLIRHTRIIRKRIFAILGGTLGLHQPPYNHHELSPRPPEHYNASW